MAELGQFGGARDLQFCAKFCDAIDARLGFDQHDRMQENDGLFPLIIGVTGHRDPADRASLIQQLENKICFDL